MTTDGNPASPAVSEPDGEESPVRPDNEKIGTFFEIEALGQKLEWGECCVCKQTVPGKSARAGFFCDPHYPASTILAMNQITREAIKLWKNSNKFLSNLDREYDAKFLERIEKDRPPK